MKEIGKRVRLKKELSVGYIFITHDLNVIKYMCDRVAVLYYGEILEQNTAFAKEKDRNCLSGPRR